MERTDSRQSNFAGHLKSKWFPFPTVHSASFMCLIDLMCHYCANRTIAIFTALPWVRCSSLGRIKWTSIFNWVLLDYSNIKHLHSQLSDEPLLEPFSLQTTFLVNNVIVFRCCLCVNSISALPSASPRHFCSTLKCTLSTRFTALQHLQCDLKEARSSALVHSAPLETITQYWQAFFG